MSSVVEGAGFPTQGELIRFAYRVAGVLPEKHDPVLPRGSTRSSVRKAIARLAQEEGRLEENFGDLLQLLSEMVAGYVSWLPVHMLIGDVLNDFIDDYRNLLVEEGTFLDRRSTVRWLIRDRWVPVAVMSLARNSAKLKPSTLLPFQPASEDWFLPDFTEQGIVWPIRKALEWLYDHAGLSQTQFHYPGRDAAEADAKKQRQLENAQNWMSGRNLPSAAALHTCLMSAVTGRVKPIESLSDPRSVQSAEAVLFLARMSTAIWKAIVDEYGEAFALEARGLFGSLWGLFMREMQSLELGHAQAALDAGLSRADPQLRSYMHALWSEDMALRMKAARERLNGINASADRLSDEQYQQLLQDYGDVPVQILASPQRLGRLHEVPTGFTEAYGEWVRLRGSQDTSAADVEAFEVFLSKQRLTEALLWMPAWLRFQQAYRREDFPAAWASISQAYELARYRAGRTQYEIVNQYVEMAAKCGTSQEFRQGIKWARYIGLEIRWIRDLPLTDENLAFAKTVLGAARYAV